MANIISNTATDFNKMRTATWVLGNADTGNAVDMHRWADRTVQIIGTIGGATITIQGSNDNTNWVTLSDNTGAALTFTAVGMKVILENPIYVRAITASGTTTAVTVIIAGAGGQ